VSDAPTPNPLAVPYWSRRGAVKGAALLGAGAGTLILHWIVPPLAPVAVAAYGVFQAFKGRLGEAALAVLIAVALWYLRPLVGWLLWMVGAGFMLGGLFYLIQSRGEAE